MNLKTAHPDIIRNEEVNLIANELSIPAYNAARILKKTARVFGQTSSVEDNINLRKQLPAIVKIIFEEVHHSEKSILPNSTHAEDRHDIIENRIQIKEWVFL